MKQRLLRIGVPLVAGAVILFPTMMVLGAWGGEVIAERTEMRAEESKAKPKASKKVKAKASAEPKATKAPKKSSTLTQRVDSLESKMDKILEILTAK